MVRHKAAHARGRSCGGTALKRVQRAAPAATPVAIWRQETTGTGVQCQLQPLAKKPPLTGPATDSGEDEGQIGVAEFPQ